MAAPDDTRQTAQAEDSGSVNGQWPSLKEYTKAHLVSSNDCAWLYELVSSDAISASTTTTKDFGTGPLDLI
jgi:hypothetical protein